MKYTDKQKEKAYNHIKKLRQKISKENNVYINNVNDSDLLLYLAVKQTNKQ